jgi:hypothetical protein
MCAADDGPSVSHIGHDGTIAYSHQDRRRVSSASSFVDRQPTLREARRADGGQTRTPCPGGGLCFRVTSRPYSRLVDAFYREYRQSSVRFAERENRAGLRLCLAMNGAQGERSHDRFGPSREHVAVLRDVNGAIAAAMNFICFPIADGVMTVHTIYATVNPAWRGRGLLRIAYRKIKDVANEYAREAGMPADPVIIFIGEQKDPFRMTLADFQSDMRISGHDAFDRLAIWAALGAQPLAFDYVQPALRIGGLSDHTPFLRLLYPGEMSEVGSSPATRSLDPNILNEHLRRFFGISVAKGQYDPEDLPEVRHQMMDLEKRLILGQSVIAHQMPALAQVVQWKRATLSLLGSKTHSAKSTIGSLIGIPSIPDLLRGVKGKLVAAPHR